MTRTARQVVRAAAAEKAEIYHLHDPELLLWSLPLRLSGARIVFDMHENLPKQILGSKPWLPVWTRGVLGRLARVAERVLLPGIPVIFAHMSYETGRSWVRRSATVLNLPLADELLAIEEPKHSVFTISYLGRVTLDRGFDTILDALEILVRKGRRLEFECVGPVQSEAKAAMMERASWAALPLRMSNEYIPADKAWKMIARCHVGFVMLKNVPNSYSNWPTKMFEYMALGIPVIASDFPYYRMVVEGSACGLCVDPESPAKLAEAIEWLMDHPDEVAEMGHRGRDAVTHQYRWSHEAEKLLRFYDDLLAPAGQDDILRRAKP